MCPWARHLICCDHGGLTSIDGLPFEWFESRSMRKINKSGQLHCRVLPLRSLCHTLHHNPTSQGLTGADTYDRNDWNGV